MRGYDKYSINHGLLVHVSMDEMTGVVTHDMAKPHHTFTLTGPPTWGSLASGLPRLLFDGANDFLECSAATSADVNFTNEDFTLIAWVYSALGAGAQIILNQGVVDVDGWELFSFTTTLSLRLNQGGAHTDISAVSAIAASTWQMVAVTRDGAAGQFYVNGQAVATAGTLTNAVSCAGGNKLLVGVLDSEAANFWPGYIAGGPCGPRIWNRELSAAEIAAIYESEKHWF